MFKILLSLCFVAVAVASPLNKNNGDIKDNILMVEDIEEYKRNNVGVVLTPLTAEVTPFGTMHYAVGDRVDGDSLVESSSNGDSFSSPQDVTFPLRYTGSIITFVQVFVDQSSDDGKAYINEGGIGETSICLVIEAKSTTHFSYNAEIYGY